VPASFFIVVSLESWRGKEVSGYYVLRRYFKTVTKYTNDIGLA